MGYSGWEYEQLIQEIKENTWLIAKEEASYLLNGEAKDMWKNTLGKCVCPYGAAFIERYIFQIFEFFDDIVHQQRELFVHYQFRHI